MRHVRCGVFVGHASRERSWARRSQDAVPAQAAPWGEIRRQPSRTDPKPRKDAVCVGVKNTSTPSLHPLSQELANSARGSKRARRPRSQERAVPKNAPFPRTRRSQSIRRPDPTGSGGRAQGDSLAWPRRRGAAERLPARRAGDRKARTTPRGLAPAPFRRPPGPEIPGETRKDHARPVPARAGAGRAPDHRSRISRNVAPGTGSPPDPGSSGGLNSGLPGDHSSTLSACSS